MRVLIIDDEPLAREELRYLLEQVENINVIGEGENGLDAVELTRKLNPDLLFLDVQMPGKTGIEAAREIVHQADPPHIVFQTAFDEFAIEAFEVQAIDYLLKPVSMERLKKTLSRLQTRPPSLRDLEQLVRSVTMRTGEDPKPLPVYAGDTIIPLKQQEILFVEARGKEVRIVSQRGEFFYTTPFWQLEEQLDLPDFIRSHRSFIVNTAYVDRIDLWVNNTYMLELRGIKERIPVSRGHIAEFRRRLNL